MFSGCNIVIDIVILLTKIIIDKNKSNGIFIS